MSRNKSKNTYKKWLFLVGVLSVFGVATKAYLDTNYFKVNHVAFETSKLPKDTEITILQISDVHNKNFGDDNERLLEAVKELNADFIVLTGDLVDRSTEDLTSTLAFAEGLTSISERVYFISGNHEWDNAYKQELLDGLGQRRITILNNKNTTLSIHGIDINLVGIDDESTNHENLDLAFAGVEGSRFTVLLSHSPGVVENNHTIPADLILSGHTHGGQIRLPFIGAVVAPNQGYFPEYDKGVFEINADQYLYIDSGLGTSVAPVRFMNQSQISLITVSGE